jgi:hypothetical protein
MKEKAKTSYKHQLVCSKSWYQTNTSKFAKNPPLLTAPCHLCMFKPSPPRGEQYCARPTQHGAHLVVHGKWIFTAHKRPPKPVIPLLSSLKIAFQHHILQCWNYYSLCCIFSATLCKVVNFAKSLEWHGARPNLESICRNNFVVCQNTFWTYNLVKNFVCACWGACAIHGLALENSLGFNG